MFGRGRKLKRSMTHDGKFYGGDDGTIKLELLQGEDEHGPLQLHTRARAERDRGWSERGKNLANTMAAANMQAGAMKAEVEMMERAGSVA